MKIFQFKKTKINGKKRIGNLHTEREGDTVIVNQYLKKNKKNHMKKKMWKKTIEFYGILLWLNLELRKRETLCLVIFLFYFRFKKEKNSTFNYMESKKKNVMHMYNIKMLDIYLFLLF